jgi:hypothetical protein
MNIIELSKNESNNINSTNMVDSNNLVDSNNMVDSNNLIESIVILPDTSQGAALVDYNNNSLEYLDNIIKNLNNNNISDELLSVEIKNFFKNNYTDPMVLDLKKKYKAKLRKYPLSFNVISDYYHYTSNQLTIVPYLQDWSKIYNNKRFWQKNIEGQINDLRELRNKFLAIFDGTKSTQYIHLKLRGASYNIYHVEEMIQRLTMLYKLFKYKFFSQIKCEMILLDDFIDMSFEKQVEYTSYLFNKIEKLLTSYIMYFKLYESYRIQLENLLIPILPFNVSVMNVSSELDTEDIFFILDEVVK